MNSKIVQLIAIFCVILAPALAADDDRLIYEHGQRVNGDELVFVQYKTSPKFQIPQDYDLTFFFDGEGNTTELTKKEIWSKTAVFSDLSITNLNNYFKVVLDKKNTRHLNATVKIYGIRLRPSDLNNKANAGTTITALGLSIIMLASAHLSRLFV